MPTRIHAQGCGLLWRCACRATDRLRLPRSFRRHGPRIRVTGLACRHADSSCHGCTTKNRPDNCRTRSARTTAMMMMMPSATSAVRWRTQVVTTVATMMMVTTTAATSSMVAVRTSPPTTPPVAVLRWHIWMSTTGSDVCR
jgi:hypothetical protein